MNELEVKRKLGRTRLRWEATIKMGLKHIGWEGVDGTYLTQDRYN